MFPLLFIAVNLSSTSFGGDDHTSMLGRLSVGSDWKNILGQDVYRNMLIYNREFANAFHGVVYPDVPTDPCYKMFIRGQGSRTSYSVTAEAEVFLCTDKGLSSRCSYMTRLSMNNNLKGAARRIYSVVIPNEKAETLSDWYDSGYNRSDGITKGGKNMLLSSTGLIDIMNNKVVSNSGVEEVRNAAHLPDCSSYSDMVYNPSIANDNIYPIGPQCYYLNRTKAMKSYANLASNFIVTGSCNDASYALYEDPGFVIGGPIVLQMYNVWKDMDIAISGYTLPHEMVPVKDIDYMSKSALEEYKILYKRIIDGANVYSGNELRTKEHVAENMLNSSSFDNYTDAKRVMEDIINKTIYDIYKEKGVDPGISHQLHFSQGRIKQIFVHTSTNAAKYLSENPYAGVPKKVSDIVGRKLGGSVPQYIKTRTYCLLDGDVNIGSGIFASLRKLIDEAPDFSADMGKRWMENFALLLTGSVVAAIVPIFIYRSGRRYTIYSCFLIALVIGAAFTSPIISYNKAAREKLTKKITLWDTDITEEGFVVVSATRVIYNAAIRKTFIAIGVIAPLLACTVILFLNVCLSVQEAKQQRAVGLDDRAEQGQMKQPCPVQTKRKAGLNTSPSVQNGQSECANIAEGTSMLKRSISEVSRRSTQCRS